jgi:hypothetical protein
VQLRNPGPPQTQNLPLFALFVLEDMLVTMLLNLKVQDNSQNAGIYIQVYSVG